MVILQLGDPAVVKGLKPNPVVTDGIPIQSFGWGKQAQIRGGTGGNREFQPAKEATVYAKGDDVNIAEILRLATDGTRVGTVKVSFIGDSKGASGYQFVLSDTFVTEAHPTGNDIGFALNFAGWERREMIRL